jgi:anaphase-promoting complex subunit 3
LRQERRGEATISFTHARELQPKLEGAIKKIMAGDGEDEEDEDDE